MGAGGGYEVEGARIVDEGTGRTYEAVVSYGDDGRPWLSSLTIIAHGPERAITNSIRVPAATIAEQVDLQLKADAAAREQTGDDRAFNIATRGLRRGAQDAPDEAQIGRDVRSGEDRHTIAAKYGVTVWTADKWLTRARRAGTVPPATRGRPPRGKESDR